MFIVTDLGEQIMREIDASTRKMTVAAINLTPPGGFIGHLPQTRVDFDPVEAVDGSLPASGVSLVTNLNRIRAGVTLGDHVILARHLASGVIVPTDAVITVEGLGGASIYDNITTIRFEDNDVVEYETGKVSVTYTNTLLSGFLETTSGITSHSWFVGGTVVSGVSNADRIFLFPNGAILSAITTIFNAVGDSDLTYDLIQSVDGTTWTSLETVVHPHTGYTYRHDLTTIIPSGTFLGISIGDCPLVPNATYENMFVMLESVESTAGGSLPEFTPKRIPFADNITGKLTESARFNLSQAGGNDMLIVGADEITDIGTLTEKVGVDIVRDDEDGGFIQEVYSDGTFAPSWAGLRARGSRAIPAAILAGDALFRFTGRGFTSTGWSTAPTFRLESRATEDYTGDGRGTKVLFGITKNGETTTTDMFTVDTEGLTVLEKTTTKNLAVQAGAVSGYVLTAIDTDGNAIWKLPTGGGAGDGAFVTYAQVLGMTQNAIRPELKNYDPDYPPTVPSTWDDEFDDDTIDAKWHMAAYDTSFNLYQSDGSKHASESSRHGLLTFQGNWHFEGPDFFQDFEPPDDEWSLVCKIYPGYNNSWNNLVSFGVCGATYYTQYYQVRLGISEDGTIGARSFYSDGTGDYEAAMTHLGIEGSVYVMISKRLDGEDTKYATFISGNGFSWIPAGETIISNLTTADVKSLYFGTYSNGSYDCINSIDFVRYFPTPGKMNIGANV